MGVVNTRSDSCKEPPDGSASMPNFDSYNQTGCEGYLDSKFRSCRTSLVHAPALEQEPGLCLYVSDIFLPYPTKIFLTLVAFLFI